MFGTVPPTIDEYLPLDEVILPYIPVQINGMYSYGN
jgi:hypothetical protein